MLSVDGATAIGCTLKTVPVIRQRGVIVSFKSFAAQRIPLPHSTLEALKPFDIHTDLKPGMRIRCTSTNFVGRFVRYGGANNHLAYGIWDGHGPHELSTSAFALE